MLQSSNLIREANLVCSQLVSARMGSGHQIFLTLKIGALSTTLLCLWLPKKNKYSLRIRIVRSELVWIWKHFPMHNVFSKCNVSKNTNINILTYILSIQIIVRNTKNRLFQFNSILCGHISFNIYTCFVFLVPEKTNIFYFHHILSGFLLSCMGHWLWRS